MCATFILQWNETSHAVGRHIVALFGRNNEVLWMWRCTEERRPKAQRFNGESGEEVNFNKGDDPSSWEVFLDVCRVIVGMVDEHYVCYVKTDRLRLTSTIMLKLWCIHRRMMYPAFQTRVICMTVQDVTRPSRLHPRGASRKTFALWPRSRGGCFGGWGEAMAAPGSSQLGWKFDLRDLLLTTGCPKKQWSSNCIYIYMLYTVLYVYIIHNSSSCIWLRESRLILVCVSSHGFFGPP